MLSRRHQGTLAAALVASLLLCHGFAGPAHPHHAGVEDAAPASAHPHGVAADGNLPGHPAGEPAGGILDCYVSVLLAVALGIAASRGPGRSRFPDVTGMLALPRWYPTGDVMSRSRAPGPALLGVFLL